MKRLKLIFITIFSSDQSSLWCVRKSQCADSMDPLPPRDAAHLFFTIESQYIAGEMYHRDATAMRLRRLALRSFEQKSKGENFDAFIPYLAASYFDRYMSTNKVPRLESTCQENRVLFEVACLTLAWKMRTKSFSVPTFLGQRNLNVDLRKVTKMEYEILRGLDYRTRSITPVCFVDYFLSLFPLRDPPPSPRLNRQHVNKIVVRAQTDATLTRFKPSVVAASAILVASLILFPAQFIHFRKAIFSSNLVPKEEVEECVDAMKGIGRGLKMISIDSFVGGATGRRRRRRRPGGASGRVITSMEIGGGSQTMEVEDPEKEEEEEEVPILMNFALNWNESLEAASSATATPSTQQQQN